MLFDYILICSGIECRHQKFESHPKRKSKLAGIFFFLDLVGEKVNHTVNATPSHSFYINGLLIFLICTTLLLC